MIYTNYKGEKLTLAADKETSGRSGIWAAIIDPKNRILISHPEYDTSFMELPGGGIEDGEQKDISLIREIEEEAGVTFPSLHSDQTYNQTVPFYAQDLDEYWQYDQEYWVIRLKHEQFFFDGMRPTEEGAFGEWVDIKKLQPTVFQHIHYQAMKKMGVV